MKLSEMRESYQLGTLKKEELHENPIAQFSLWLEQAKTAQVLEPNAMTLATVSVDGQPSTRIVLLKEIREEGFVFFTNYESQKGQEIAQNSCVSLHFLWKSLQRQVIIIGAATKISEEDSTHYFQSRPKGSQIGAWASDQSKIITDRRALEQKTKDLEKKYQNVAVLPKPPNWGGYLVTPTSMEFWQGRPNRLHDRFRYSRSADWKIDRLSP